MGHCECDYGDGPEVFRAKTVTARKAHKCSECRGEIAATESYELVFGIWDGDALTFKACPDCVALRSWVEAHVPCFCWAFGTLHNDARDTMSDWDSECPGLYAETKAKIAAIRAKRRPAAPPLPASEVPK